MMPWAVIVVVAVPICCYDFEHVIMMCISITINIVTPQFIPAGMKNSLSEDFWLAKHKDTNIPTMMVPFSPPAAWF